jgi:hypothetical protein
LTLVQGKQRVKIERAGTTDHDGMGDFGAFDNARNRWFCFLP